MKMKFYTQIAQNECGLCCIATIASNYGFIQNLKFFRDLHYVGRDGMSMGSMIEIFKKIKMDAVIVKFENSDQFHSFHVPFIALTNKKHFVVVEKIKSKDVYIIDPANGRTSKSINEFLGIIKPYCLIVSPDEEFMKCKDNTSELRYVIKSINNTKSKITAVIIASGFVYLSQIIIPMTVQKSIDRILSTSNIGIQSLLLAFISCNVFLLASFIRNKVVVNLSSTLYSDLSKNSISHLFRIPYRFFDNHLSGEILFRFNLLDSVRTIITGSLIPMILDFGSTVIILFYLFFLNYRVAVLLCMTLLIISVIIKCFNKVLLIANKQELNKLQKANELKTEIVQSMFQIKNLRLEDTFQRKYYELFDELLIPFKKREKINMLYSTTVAFLKQYIPFVFIIILATFVNTLGLTIGELFALYSLISMLLASYIAFFQNLSNFSLFKSTLYYINDLLDEPIDERKGKLEIEDFKQMLFQNVSFKYNDTSNYVVNGLSFELLRGQTIAFVGASGSGKSSIIKLVMGLYGPTEGTIYINGYKYNDYNFDHLTKIFSIVPQNPIVFNKSIRENILLDQNIVNSDNDIALALKTAELYDEVMMMPMKEDTILINQGANISGGQLQRLAIARAVIKRPFILILDEATSAIDPNTEKRILENLRNMKCSCILISHRMSTIFNCNKIYVLKDSHVCEEGDHCSLMKQQGIYYNMIRTQIIK